jgi:Protein of unknown function (DUF3309)
MQRWVIVVLSGLLLAVMPVWPFARQWGFGPAIVVGFLLLINLLMALSDRVGRTRDKT